MKSAAASGTPTADSGLERLLRVELAILAFVVVLALFPFIRDPAVDTKILVYTIGGGVFAVVCAVGLWLRKTGVLQPTRLSEVLLALLALFLVAAVHAQFHGYAFETVCHFIPLYLIAFIAAHAYRRPEQVQGFMLAMCGAVALSCVYGIFQHFGLDPFPWNPDLKGALKEAPGTFGNGNLAAHTTVLCIVMAIYLAVTKRRFWYLGFVVVFLVHLELSNQRGGIVGLLAASVLLAVTWLAYRRLRKPLPTILATFVAMALIAVLGLMGAMAAYQARTGTPYPTSITTLLRIHGYSGAARMIEQHPVLGYGPGNYRYVNPAFWTPFEQEHFALKRKMNYRAHDDILEIGTEAGLPAAGLYALALLLGIGYGLWMGLADADRSRRQFGLAFAAFCCTFMVDGLFGFNLRVPVSGMLLFLMVGAFEGVRAGGGDAVARRLPHWGSSLVYGVVCIASVGVIAFESCAFAAEMYFQRASGAIYYKMYPEADQFLVQAQRLIPWDSEYAYQRGECALRTYNPKVAIEQFERGAALNPNFPPAWVALAHGQLMLAELAMADAPVAERLRVLDAADENTQRALKLCAPLGEAEDVRGRVASLRATILQQHDPASPAIKESWQQAETHFLRAIDFKTRELDRVYTVLARARMALGNSPGAQDALLRAVSINPTNTTAWNVFNQFAETPSRKKQMRDTLVSTVARMKREGKDVPASMDALASLWGKDGGLLAASTQFAEAARGQSAKPAAGTTPQRDNLTWAADIMAQEAANPAVPRSEAGAAVYNVAYVYASAGAWQKVAGAMTAFGGAMPERLQGDAAVLYAEALTQLNQPDQAIEVLRNAALRIRGHLLLQVSLARAYARANRPAEARLEYGTILSQFDLKPPDRQKIQQELDALPPSVP